MSKLQKTRNMYIIGFVSSIVLTVIAFGATGLHTETHHTIPPHDLIVPILLGLAVIQLFVQIIFFLHLGKESKPRLNLMAFLFMILVVLIVVIGSLWIMQNLDYNMQHSPNIEQNIIKDEGIKPSEHNGH